MISKRYLFTVKIQEPSHFRFCNLFCIRKIVLKPLYKIYYNVAFVMCNIADWLTARWFSWFVIDEYRTFDCLSNLVLRKRLQEEIMS
jgi:hypothetical protein